MGYESIAHEAEGRMGYWFRGYEAKIEKRFWQILASLPLDSISE